MELGGKQVSKRELVTASGQLIFWLVETIFFYSSETLASDSFFLAGENDVSKKSLIPASGNGFRANNGKDWCKATFTSRNIYIKSA